MPDALPGNTYTLNIDKGKLNKIHHNTVVNIVTHW